MRKLGLKDVFAFSEILDKMGLNIDAADLVAQSKDKENAQEFVGGQIIMLILKNFYKAEEAVVSWLGSINDMTDEEVTELGLAELTQLIKDLFSGEDMTDFFNLLSTAEQD